MLNLLEEIVCSVDTEIEGITPLIIHACTSAGISKNRKLSEEAKNNEWKTEIYLNKDKKLIMPERNLMASFLRGASGEKIGKATMRSLFASAVTIGDFEPLIKIDGKPITINDIKSNDWFITCPVKISSARVVKTRVCLPAGWKINFMMNVAKIEPQIEKADLINIVEKAGRFAGLGVWRPSSPKPGRYGQFQVNKFDVM